MLNGHGNYIGQGHITELTARDSGDKEYSGLNIDTLFIDAGTRHFRIQGLADDGSTPLDKLLPSNCDLSRVLATLGLAADNGTGFDPARTVITGKLAPAVRARLGGGRQIMPAAAFWMAARDLIGKPENAAAGSLAMIDLSASGYLLIGVDRDGRLKDDLLITNPRCGAGSGINLDRVLQKLDLRHDQVDTLLEPYLGAEGRERRENTAVRVDRCGVFSTSATISDKNQGIPLETALATTLKSEVLKTVKKLPAGFDRVYLCGRIFRWRYTRDCASDYLESLGITDIACDPENGQLLASLRKLVATAGIDNLAQPDPRLVRQPEPKTYPSFGELRDRYTQDRTYRRLPDEPIAAFSPDRVDGRAMIMALDVGSTMAKVVLADAESGEILLLDAYSNAGDTIETVKKVFADIMRLGVEHLPLQSIGITGSARYQVQQALASIYPDLSERVQVLVENYAHARGSIDHARRHVDWLQDRGIDAVNRNLCILVDIGGEDTKISTIALNEAELFDNAMNTKCSAGTGSLMDTLSSMFGLGSVAEAQAQAFAAAKSFDINATCAVFLMENASKLQARGVPREQILASANWAIVENMARSLWSQLDLPPDTVVLLHGQTMLSEPLPLAVTDRLRSFVGGNIHALVPPHPGHRACIGLVRSLQQAAAPGTVSVRLGDLLDADFSRRLIQCKGKVCGDPLARCNRCALRWQGDDGRKIAFTVGGCTAINELISHKGRKKENQPRDTYKEIWDFVDSHHPRSEDPNRLVIPRSFVVSEWAYFLSRVFTTLGIPVHVDNVRDSDLADAQPLFNIDCCAPQMGAVGQYQRLAAAPHGMILAPQIESLPTGGLSSGLTCTTNQGGIAVAKNLALEKHPAARFHLFNFTVDELDAGFLSDQLLSRLEPVFRHYGVAPDAAELSDIIAAAIDDHLELRRQTADFAAELAESALAEGHQIALVVGREYILNPGIYDSHIRRLLRDRQMAVIPSYVLDIELDPEFSRIYWRNPHFILSLLNAVARRKLHTRLKHPRLQAVFRRIEQDPEGPMLPVAQVSTFSCGPDSIIKHYVAEIMKQRPFLLIQSDAVLKELAHLENRVNTYVMQLRQGLHRKLGLDDREAFEIRTLDELVSTEPLNPDSDVICLPTMADNRSVTSILRAAGYTCIENYADESYDLHGLVKAGRRVTGEEVCAPMAGVYADLARGVEEFGRRRRAGDPGFAGKKRLILLDPQGNGPCRQGQYAGAHQLFIHNQQPDNLRKGCRPGLANGALHQFIMLEEEDGYRGGFPEWIIMRVYQAIILKGVLQDLKFKLGANCRDYAEFEQFSADFKALQSEIYQAMGSFGGPGRFGGWLLRKTAGLAAVNIPLKYFVYRLHGREFIKPLKKFARRWRPSASASADKLRLLISGEIYMRLSQADEIFSILQRELGFRRFVLDVSPMMGYLEVLLEEARQESRNELEIIRARAERTDNSAADSAEAVELKRRMRTVGMLRFLLRNVLAKPLYRAGGLPMPPAVDNLIDASRELLPTARPRGELPPYLGEALYELRHGVDIVLNVAPNGCMVSTMGEVLTPSIMSADGVEGNIQTLLSAEGDVDEEILSLAVLKATGPHRYYGITTPAAAGAEVSPSVAG